jgi:hypothetical protein
LLLLLLSLSLLLRITPSSLAYSFVILTLFLLFFLFTSSSSSSSTTFTNLHNTDLGPRTLTEPLLLLHMSKRQMKLQELAKKNSEEPIETARMAALS